MRLISFDVGIKNMAYCIIETASGSPIRVLDWNVLNLLDPPSEPPKCSCITESKPTKSKPKTTAICSKKAKYQKGEQYFCDKHARTCSFLIPTKECSLVTIKKKKINEVILFCRQHMLLSNSEGTPIDQLLKKDIIELCSQFIQTKVLDPTKTAKQKTSAQTDLVTIGRRMCDALDKIPDINAITHVIIENQISPIANRMKTVQGMLSQYFIMRGSPTLVIEYVSSIQKLKGFETTGQPIPEQPQSDQSKTKYKQHKMDGITYCSRFIKNNENLKTWEHILETTKKDDLADSFLQGVVYLKNKKIITYADNLEINSV